MKNEKEKVQPVISLSDEMLELLNKSFKDACGRTVELLTNSTLYLISNLDMKFMLHEGDQFIDHFIFFNERVRVVSVDIKEGTAVVSIVQPQIPIFKIIVKLTNLAASIK